MTFFAFPFTQGFEFLVQPFSILDLQTVTEKSEQTLESVTMTLLSIFNSHSEERAVKRFVKVVPQEV